MIKVKVTSGAVTVGAEVALVLTPEQATPRAHKLRPGDKPGQFVATAPLQFKAGETLSLAELAPADLPKVELVEPPAAPAAFEAPRQTSRTRRK